MGQRQTINMKGVDSEKGVRDSSGRRRGGTPKISPPPLRPKNHSLRCRLSHGARGSLFRKKKDEERTGLSWGTISAISFHSPPLSLHPFSAGSPSDISHHNRRGTKPGSGLVGLSKTKRRSGALRARESVFHPISLLLLLLLRTETVGSCIALWW